MTEHSPRSGCGGVIAELTSDGRLGDSSRHTKLSTPSPGLRHWRRIAWTFLQNLCWILCTRYRRMRCFSTALSLPEAMLHILLVLKLLSTIATPAATSTGMAPAVTMATRSRRLTMMIGLRTQQLAGKCNWESCWETLLSLWQLRWHCLLSARISSVQSTLSCSKLRDKFKVYFLAQLRSRWHSGILGHKTFSVFGTDLWAT